jgi:hypothetical protein
MGKKIAKGKGVLLFVETLQIMTTTTTALEHKTPFPFPFPSKSNAIFYTRGACISSKLE